MSPFENGAAQPNPPQSAAVTPEGAEEFDAAWASALGLFSALAGIRMVRLNLRHPETGELMVPHEGVEGTFEDWKQIRTPWDRRLCLMLGMLEVTWNQLSVWARANALSALRQPDKALEILREAGLPDTQAEDCAAHCASYARALLGLDRVREALDWAQAAAAAAPNDGRLQVLLADALHLSGQPEPAHEIYAAQMATVPEASTEPSNPVADMFARLFSRETGVIPSPVFALDIAGQLEDAQQREEFWALGQTEFYDSPQFRMQHAYTLLKGGEVQRAFAKLAALVQEMPWVREANLNFQQVADHLDPSGNRLMPELRREVAQAIEANGWTTEGMQLMQIPTA